MEKTLHVVRHCKIPAYGKRNMRNDPTNQNIKRKNKSAG